jgi:Ca-activated chloride channel family protein
MLVMNFLWPQSLWLMLALPVLPVLYLWLLRRRRKAALRYSSLTVVRETSSGRLWRRYLPPAFLWIACAVLLLAAARPLARVTMPWARSTVMLAMDVSLSMRVSDVKPTRLAAAQEAAKLFLRDLPRGIEVGLVTFAASTQVVQASTLDRNALVSAIDAFQMQYGTAIGNAIVVCLAELFPEHGINLGDMTFGPRQKARGWDARDNDPQLKQITPVAPGSYGSAAILLLTDGRRTTGVDTLEAAKMAADRGVRIHVVGLGTVDGDVASGTEGWAIYMKLDEPTLREVARMTGGEYHHAGSAEELRSVYKDLGSRLQVQTRETEITALLALVAATLVLAAVSLSMLWFGGIDGVRAG